jgi:hypothetical protein
MTEQAPRDLRETLSAGGDFARAVQTALDSNRSLEHVRELVPDAAAFKDLYNFAVEHGVEPNALHNICSIPPDKVDTPSQGHMTYGVQKILERLQSRL